ncbi:MAG: alginate export family protein, partial [Verrucomicrobiota bacterium]
MKILNRACRSTLSIGTATALFASDLNAAPQAAGLWTSLETRLRFDSLEAAGMGNINSDFLRNNADEENRYLYLRSTLDLGYRIADGGEGFVQFRDNRTRDYDAPNKGLDRPIDLYQAWYSFPASQNFPVSAKLGRQEFDFGSKILVGTPNYKKGRSYDALRLDCKTPVGKITAFSGRIVTQKADAFNDSSESRNTLSGLNLQSEKVLKKLDTQLYYFNKSNENRTSTKWGDIHSVGTQVTTSKDPKTKWS